MSDLVRPTREDPLARSASEGIGGPVGDHAAPHPWWTPVRVVLAVAALALLLGMAQKSPCVRDHWQGDGTRYSAMCYSDIPYLYSGRGFAERIVPYTGSRYGGLEYPVGIGYFAYGAAIATQALKGWPDVSSRAALSLSEVGGAPGVQSEADLYFEFNAVLLGAVALLAVWLLTGVHRRRPWDAMLVAASPALVLTGLINWDILALATVAGALWSWSRGRPLLAGVWIGLGFATKLYPVFLLGALLVVCLRRRRVGDWVRATLAALVVWLALDLPAMFTSFAQWKTFWTFNDARGADLGSAWLVAQQVTRHTFVSGTINEVSWLFFAAVCTAVLVLGLAAPRIPRIPQLAFLIVVGFLLVNKVYSPQYVLWLLPLAALARPRWRDLLIWQAGEAFYFAAVWWYLGGFTASSADQGQDHVYWIATLVRIAAELYLVVLVVRDILAPWHDPVRADGVTDDPMEPSCQPLEPPSVLRLTHARADDDPPEGPFARSHRGAGAGSPPG